MAPTFAELKAKAAKAKDASVSKIQNTKDRHTSVPLAKTNWDPYNKQPVPPPPPRANPSSRPANHFPPPPPPPNKPTSPSINPPSLPNRPIVPVSRASPPPAPRLPPRTPSSPGPPPIIRSTRPDLAARPPETPSDQEIDWTNLTAEDKKVFFSWLDEFFSKFLNVTIPPRKGITVYGSHT